MHLSFELFVGPPQSHIFNPKLDQFESLFNILGILFKFNTPFFDCQFLSENFHLLDFIKDFLFQQKLLSPMFVEVFVFYIHFGPAMKDHIEGVTVFTLFHDPLTFLCSH